MLVLVIVIVRGQHQLINFLAHGLARSGPGVLMCDCDYLRFTTVQWLCTNDACIKANANGIPEFSNAAAAGGQTVNQGRTYLK